MQSFRPLFAASLLGLLLLLPACGPGPGEEGERQERPGPAETASLSAYLEDEVIVRQRAGTVRTAAVGELLPGAREIDRLTVGSLPAVRAAGASQEGGGERSFTLTRLHLPPGLSVPEAIERLRNQPGVENVEPNYRVRKAVVSPDDAFFGQQWGLANTGQTFSGVFGTVTGRPGADVAALEAWDVTTGNGQVTVAIIDSGIDLDHPDLISNIWDNPNEQPGDANGDGFPGVGGVDDDGDGLIDEDSCSQSRFLFDGVTPNPAWRTNILQSGILVCQAFFLSADDDENGYENDLHGWNFVANSGNPEDDDSPGHGSHVAGIIGAKGGNGIGVSGIDWNSRLMALKFLDSQGFGNVFTAIKAIHYAIANGARIINASYEYSDPRLGAQEERLAIQEAAEAGVLFVAAAGNGDDFFNPIDNDRNPTYPASHPLPNLIAVAATDPNDGRVSFSNYGANTVHLGAPGLYIYSTVRTAYGYLSGTSMAAPCVSGAAALLWSKYPDLSYSEVRSILLATVDPVPALAGRTVSGGRLNLARAMQVDLSLLAPAAPGDLIAEGIGGGAVRLSWRDLSETEAEFAVERAAAGAGFSVVARVSANETSFTDLNTPDGTSQSYRVRALAGFRSSAPSNEVTIVVPLKPPSGLSAITSPAGVELHWSAASPRAESYSLERRLSSEASFAPLVTLPPVTVDYHDTTAVPGQAYVYRLRAFNATAGYSADSPEVTAVMPAAEKKGGGSGCFIATAAWGSPYAAEVTALRTFRDRVLLHHDLGRRFVALYYRLSPPIAEVVAESPLLRQIVRTLLWPVARLAAVATPAEAMERRPPASDGPSVIEGELLVRFRKEVPEERVAAVIKEERCEILERLPMEDGVLYRLRLPSGLGTEEATARFIRHAEVVSAEPNRRVQVRPAR